MSLQRKRMKNLTNILSYLWLLLLMAVTACSDLEEEVGPMQGEEEVELNIRAELSEMATSTRAVPTENIYSITALAFDVDSKLIKVVAATLGIQQATSGTLKVKVPLRTRSIHFLANDAAGITANDLGKTPNELLKKDVGSLYYWGMASFQGNNAAEAAAALKAYAGPLTLYRNQAKVTLVGGNGDYIVGFLNYNTQGRLVPYDANGTIGYQASVQTSAGTPSPQSHTKENNISGQQYTEYFLFEHDNEKNSALYAICYIGGKYYKVAFASSQTYFDIVRNHNYRIVTTGIDTMYGEDSFDAAEDSDYPINDKVIVGVQGMTATAKPALISNTAGTTTQVTVTIPEGLTELKINAGTAFTVTSNESLAVNANGSYNITGRTEATFTLTLKDEAAGTTGEQTISCTARAKYKEATCSTTVTLQQPTAKLLITAPGETEGVSNASVEMSYSNQSAIEEYTITVTVPDGVTELNYDTNDGFSNVYISNGNGWYNDASQSINTSETKSIPLKLRVDKNNANPTITFSADNVDAATFTVERTAGTTNSDVVWEGASQFQGYDVHVSKIDIPYNLLQGNLFDGAVLTVEYELTTNDNGGFLSIHGSGISNWANLKDVAAENYSDNNYSTITMTLNPTIIENIGNGSINMQGDGRVLKKVTLTPPADVQFKVLEETISLDLATNETVLYVQKPANVTELTITDNDNLFGSVSTTFANANVNGKTVSNLPNYAATIPVKLEITQVVDIKNYTITVSTNDGRSDNVTINLLSTWSGSHSLGNWEGFWGSARKLPVGSTVQITFANYNNCLFELHTYKSSTEFGDDVRLEGYSTTEVNNGNPEDYISTSHLTNGVFTFTVATDGSVMIRNNGNLKYLTDAVLDGLQINGGNGLSVTQVSVTLGSGEITPTEFTYNFEDGGVILDSWNNLETNNVYDEVLKSNVLKLTVKIENGYDFAQLGITGNYTGSYTLSLRYRIGTSEASDRTMNLVFQEGESEGYTTRATYSYTNISTSENTFNQQITLSGNVEQFVIKFEDVKENDIFYIDDLKLERTN